MILNQIKFPLKRKECQVVVSVLFLCVRHLGTFVKASHNWYGTVGGLQEALGKPYLT